MHKAIVVFRNSMREAREQNSLFHHINNLGIPVNVDDLLRGQIVNSVAAFDKLMHDLIRIGMVQTFLGSRVATAKYLTETIDMETHGALKAAVLPPAEVVFEQVIVRKLSRLSFQDPQKVSEGLSLIWNENHKWERIGATLGKAAKDSQTELRLIAQRRNAIVHESDMDPVTYAKTPISSQDANNITNFLENCGQAIHSLL